jgi:hypothetical protein
MRCLFAADLHYSLQQFDWARSSDVLLAFYDFPAEHWKIVILGESAADSFVGALDVATIWPSSNFPIMARPFA